MNTTDKCIIEGSGPPLAQLYKTCINHLIEMGYKFKLEFENETQVVIDMGEHGCIDFFDKRVPRPVDNSR